MKVNLNTKTDSNISFSITDFNNRTDSSFSMVYSLLFRELNYFANKLFYSTEIDSQDLVQDVFVALWNNKKVSFSSIENVKNYLYLAIKNRHKNYLRHSVQTKIYAEHMQAINNFHNSNIIETEVISLLSIADNLLPKECATTFKLFMEGYNPREIAVKLKKSIFTIYHQRDEAVKKLKRHFTKIIITFFSSI